MSFRLGIDFGGTFTDLVLFDEATSKLLHHKLPSTPSDAAPGMIEGIKALTAQIGSTPSQVNFLIHGTTIATNAILEHKGEKTALITTEGFRDMLHIVRQDRPKLYDFFARRPEPLVPRHLRFEARERILYTGEVIKPLDVSAVRRVAAEILRQKVDSVAICFLHSYANPVHELQVREILNSICPDLHISLSCEILPEFKEYERMSTTVINAYVQPIMRLTMSI